MGPSAASETFARAWSQISGSEFKTGMTQKIYQLEKVQFPESVNGKMEVATSAKLELITDWAYQFTIESLPHEPTSKLECLEIARIRIEKGEVFIWKDVNSNPVSINVG